MIAAVAIAVLNGQFQQSRFLTQSDQYDCDQQPEIRVHGDEVQSDAYEWLVDCFRRANKSTYYWRVAVTASTTYPCRSYCSERRNVETLLFHYIPIL